MWSSLLRWLRPHHRRLILATAAILFVTLLGMAPPLILAALIDHVVGANQYHWLAPLMIFWMLLPALDGVVRTLGNYLVALVAQRVLLDIRLALYRKVQNLSFRYLQSTTTGKLMERLRGDVAQVHSLLTSQTIHLFVQLVYGLVILVVMFVLSVPLTLLAVGAIGLYVANYKWFVRRISAVQKRYRRKMDTLSGMAQERLAGTIVVKAFAGERREARDFHRLNFLAERVNHRFRMLNVSYGLASSLLAWLTYLAVLLSGVYLAARGHLTYGAVTATGAFTWRLINPALLLAELSNQVEQSRVALGRIFELMRAESDAVDKPGLRLPTLRGEVSFENLCFDYEPGKPLLRHVNLHVPAGKTVAFVGATGCGKSTLLSLLYRYYEPLAGHLMIDGHEISTLDTRWYRRRLALVPQDPIVFDTTIADNIAYGRRRATAQQIEHAARVAELGRLLDRLPEGLETKLGEYGVSLSLGERQRICIARAILADPAILLLDEATSSLDPASEALIQVALRRLMRHRTSFVIAHRLGTIVHADLIVVLDAGRIVETGTHAELMCRKSGAYRSLYTTQVAQQRPAGAPEAVPA